MQTIITYFLALINCISPNTDGLENYSKCFFFGAFSLALTADGWWFLFWPNLDNRGLNLCIFILLLGAETIYLWFIDTERRTEWTMGKRLICQHQLIDPSLKYPATMPSCKRKQKTNQFGGKYKHIHTHTHTKTIHIHINYLAFFSSFTIRQH